MALPSATHPKGRCVALAPARLDEWGQAAEPLVKLGKCKEVGQADMGVHAIDTARFLLGDPRPVSVYARIGTYYCDADGPEAGTQLYGRTGLAQLFPTGLRVPRGPAICGVSGEWDTVDPGFPFPRREHCTQAMYDAQMAYFVDCVRAGRTPVRGGAEGLVNMRIVDAAYESARTGQVVELQGRGT